MDLKSSWEGLASHSLGNKWPIKQKGDERQISVEPLYFPDSSQNKGFYGASANPRLNIVSEPTLWDGEFFGESQAAAEIRTLELYPDIDFSKAPIFLNHPHWATSEGVDQALKRWGPHAREIHFCWDPWAKMLHRGLVPQWSDSEYPVGKFSAEPSQVGHVFRFSSEIYQWAGASAMEELGILLATAAQALRYFESQWEPRDWSRRIAFELAMSTEPLWNGVKVEALKVLWARLQECTGLTPEPGHVYGCPSLRHFSRREPWNNLVRLTLMQVGASLGSARGFRQVSHETFSKNTSDHSRLGRNIGFVLNKECHLDQVENPLSGSYSFESLVESLCEKAWLFFQEIEQKGGLEATLQSGWIQSEIQASHQHEMSQFNEGKKKLIGVNNYVFSSPQEGGSALAEDQCFSSMDWLEIKNKPWAEMSKSIQIKPVVPVMLSAGFESALMATDQWAIKNGKKPEVLVFCESPGEQKERVGWLKERIQWAGFDFCLSSDVSDKFNVQLVICMGPQMESDYWELKTAQFKELGFRDLVWFGESQNQSFNRHWKISMTPEQTTSWLQNLLGGLNEPH